MTITKRPPEGPQSLADESFTICRVSQHIRIDICIQMDEWKNANGREE